MAGFSRSDQPAEAGYYKHEVPLGKRDLLSLGHRTPGDQNGREHGDGADYQEGHNPLTHDGRLLPKAGLISCLPPPTV